MFAGKGQAKHKHCSAGRRGLLNIWENKAGNNGLLARVGQYLVVRLVGDSVGVPTVGAIV